MDRIGAIRRRRWRTVLVAVLSTISLLVTSTAARADPGDVTWSVEQYPSSLDAWLAAYP